jgi:hypothetical protein
MHGKLSIIGSLPLLKCNFVLLREHADAQLCLSLHCCQVRVMQAWQRSGRSPSGSPEGAYEGSREPRPSPVRAGLSSHTCCHLIQCGLIWFTRT